MNMEAAMNNELNWGLIFGIIMSIALWFGFVWLVVGWLE